MNSADPFAAIVNAHYEPLYRFAMCLTRSEADAWDLTQQTFYIWATKGHQLRDISKVKTWLYTTLHRAFLQARRKQSRFLHDELEDVADELPTVSPTCIDQVDSSHALTVLARVEENYQAPIALFYLEDCSYKEIAEILDVPLGTVKSRIARGIAQLREILLSHGSHGSSFNTDRISSIANPDAPAASPENTVPLPRQHAPVATNGYEEWDFSSTHLREPPAAV